MGDSIYLQILKAAPEICRKDSLLWFYPCVICLIKEVNE